MKQYQAVGPMWVKGDYVEAGTLVMLTDTEAEQFLRDGALNEVSAEPSTAVEAPAEAAPETSEMPRRKRAA